jgi:hypothetical protein
MRYLLLLIPLLFTGCSHIKFVTTERGHLVTDKREPVKILGNPPVACHLLGQDKVYTGFFMYQDDDGAIFIDDYGRNIIRLHGDVTCELLDDTRL